MYKIAKVVIDKATASFDKEYDYYIPPFLNEIILSGCRVTVPFGGYNKRKMGMVMSVFEAETRENLKPIASIIDNSPILNKEALSIVYFLKKYSFCTYFDAIKVVIPSGMGFKLGTKFEIVNSVSSAISLSETAENILSYIKSKKGTAQKKNICKALKIDENNDAFSELIKYGIICEVNDDKRKINDEKATMAKIAQDYNPNLRLTPKQKSVIDMLSDVSSASVKEICYYCSVTKVVVTKLQDLGAIELYEQEIYRNPYEYDACENKELTLTKQQNDAFNTLLNLYSSHQSSTALLYGVTGSGKTSVFVKLIDEVLKDGKNVIVMVPEISLTPQTVSRFQKYFGNKTAVLHSSLTMSQRLDEWKRIKNSDAKIVIGTRSAVFAPLENIGLIIMDEEQEATYKSQNAPRFHAKDIAAFRCKNHNAMLLLASATPSIESYYYAKSGKYTLVTLTERYSGSQLPDVYVVDMKENLSDNATAGICGRIIEELYLNLKNKEQSILLLNRRGYSTSLTCSSCGEVMKCPNCSVALTYHSANNKVMCHYCGYTSDIIEECPTCKGKMLRYTGVGTQKAQEELQKVFPDARILRMDMDTTMNRLSYEENFKKFGNLEYDIMLGTQMVAKGLDFPNVTLVGVLTADQALFSQSFRGYERAFSLITQVVGRGGRGKLKGRAFIQTMMPDNKIIELAAMQDYNSYYKDEILFRKINLYPPYCKLSCLVFVGENEIKLAEAANFCSNVITTVMKNNYPNLPIRMLMPTPANVYKLSGKYFYNILIKHTKTSNFYDMLWSVYEKFEKTPKYRDINMYIDTNYDG